MLRRCGPRLTLAEKTELWRRLGLKRSMVDSINSIGPQYSPPDVVRDWGPP